MRIALFLPHVGVFGGVRRFLELGNSWSRMGHGVTLYHPEGVAPAWLPFAGRVERLERSASERSDLAISADPHTLAAFLAAPAGQHLYYCVIEGDAAIARVARESGVRLAANSGPLRRHLARATGRHVLDGIGGISPAQFHPDASRRAGGPLRILLNGRRSRATKGTDLILRALTPLAGRTPEFEIVLFDSIDRHNRQDPRDGAPLPPRARFVINPSQEELAGLYQSAHVFIAAERKAGWCNTALEALASGCAVICTRSGTTDFAQHERNALVTWRHEWFVRRAAERLLRDAPLRARLAAAGPSGITPWTWDALAQKLLSQLESVPA